MERVKSEWRVSGISALVQLEVILPVCTQRMNSSTESSSESRNGHISAQGTANQFDHCVILRGELEHVSMYYHCQCP